MKNCVPQRPIARAELKARQNADKVQADARERHREAREAKAAVKAAHDEKCRQARHQREEREERKQRLVSQPEGGFTKILIDLDASDMRSTLADIRRKADRVTDAAVVRHAVLIAIAIDRLDVVQDVSRAPINRLLRLLVHMHPDKMAMKICDDEDDHHYLTQCVNRARDVMRDSEEWQT